MNPQSNQSLLLLLNAAYLSLKQQNTNFEVFDLTLSGNKSSNSDSSGENATRGRYNVLHEIWW